MATQLAEIHGDNDDHDNAVDFESEARKLGWKPVEDFKGDPGKHVDAETFYKRGQELMPILKAQNRDLIKRLDQMERDQKRSAEFFSKAEERAYERALSDIKSDMANAVEAGDTKAADAALDKLTKLEKPGATPKPADVDPAQRAEEFADWGKRNSWYGTNELLRTYADAQADSITRGKGGAPLDMADLDAIAEKVRAKFEDTYPDAFGAKPAARTARNPVDGGGTPPPRRGGRSFADLPADAQRMCDKWVKNGTIKDRDTYVRSYQWDDKK